MAYEIVWTENARDDLKSIFKFLHDDWSSVIAEKFIEECETKIDLISHFPYIGIQSAKIKSVHRILITKHNALYYKLEADKIILLDFFDTRQNPSKNKL